VDRRDDFYREIPTAVIPDVRSVRLYDSTLRHVSERHVEFRQMIFSLEYAIVHTLQRPTEVRISPRQTGGQAYKFCSHRHRLGEAMLIVAIKIITARSALMKTAYFAAAPTGLLVWRTTDV
jgi:hypothetical protein